MSFYKLHLRNRNPLRNNKCVSEVNQLFFVERKNSNDKNKRVFDLLELIHQKRTHVISFRRTLFCYRPFVTDYIFSTNQLICKNVYHQTLKVDLCLIMEDNSLLRRMFELVRNKEI